MMCIQIFHVLVIYIKYLKLYLFKLKVKHLNGDSLIFFMEKSTYNPLKIPIKIVITSDLINLVYCPTIMIIVMQNCTMLVKHVFNSRLHNHKHERYVISVFSCQQMTFKKTKLT